MLGNAAYYKSEMRNVLGNSAEFFNSYFFSGHLMSVSKQLWRRGPGVRERDSREADPGSGRPD